MKTWLVPVPGIFNLKHLCILKYEQTLLKNRDLGQNFRQKMREESASFNARKKCIKLAFE